MSVPPSLSEVVRDGLGWQLLQTMAEAVFLIDPESLEVIEQNDAAIRLTKCSSGWPIGQPLTNAFQNLDAERLQSLLRTVDGRGPEYASESETAALRTDDEQLVSVQLTGRLLNANRSTIGMVIARPVGSRFESTTPSVRSPASNEERPEEFDGALTPWTEERFHRLFNESPIALFEMDWSGVRKRLQQILDSGVTDVASWLQDNPDELVELSRLARITAANRGALEMFDATGIEDFRGHVGSVMQEDSLREFKRHLLWRLKGNRSFETENAAYTFSGRRIHIHVRATSAADSDHPIGRIHISISNITQRKHAELLRDGQRRVLESLASSSSVQDVLCTLTAELEQQSPYLRAAVFRTTSSRQALRVMTSASTAQELVTLIDSVRVNDLFPKEHGFDDIRLNVASQQSGSANESHRPAAIEEMITRAVRLCGYGFGILKPAISQSGQLLGILAVFRRESESLTPHEEDVVSGFSRLTSLVLQHDQRRRALIIRTDELQSVFETYPDALLRISSDGTILDRYSGNRLAEILRLSEVPSEQILWHLLPQEAAGRVHRAIQNVEAGCRQETVQFTIGQEPDRRDYEARFLKLPSSDEQIAILRDVTQLKRTELALEQASERFRYLFDSSPDAIFVESHDGVVMDANRAACELHQLSREQLIGQDVLALIPQDDWEAAKTRAASLVSGEISEFESRSLRSDGQIIPVGVRISPIAFDGKPAILLHVRDISQQKIEETRKRDHERQMAHVSRLTMMGQLVAGIAHEIRQPLWSLSTFADVCLESLNRPDCADRLDQIREVAARVVAEAARANSITTRMLSFARKGTSERTECSLAEIARDAIKLTASRARAGRIRTTLSTPEKLPRLLCDRVLIEQTFANLLNNAYSALETHESTSREVVISLSWSPDAEEYVFASVRDNGPGLPDGVSPEQLFEGFFTTGQTGLGIGLALSRSFVEDHGGAIGAEQLPHGGMEFLFTLRIDGGYHADAV